MLPTEKTKPAARATSPHTLQATHGVAGRDLLDRSTSRRAVRREAAAALGGGNRVVSRRRWRRRSSYALPARVLDAEHPGSGGRARCCRAARRQRWASPRRARVGRDLADRLERRGRPRRRAGQAGAGAWAAPTSETPGGNSTAIVAGGRRPRRPRHRGARHQPPADERPGLIGTAGRTYSIGDST